MVLVPLCARAQRGEFFIEVDAENESFEIVAPIEGVMYVATMAPAFSEDLGQYTFFQALPEKAAITVDVDNGEVVHYAPITGLLSPVYPSHLRRVNDGRIFGLISYFTEVHVVAFDPAIGGEPDIIASVFPEGFIGSMSLYVTGYNPVTNRFYLQYNYDIYQNLSFMIEVDVATGEILSDFVCSPGLNDLFYHSGSNAFLGMYTEGDFAMAYRRLGWFNPEDGSMQPLTTNATQIQFHTSNLSSLDEDNEKIYVTRYSGFPGSEVEVISYGGGSMESNTYLVLESDYPSFDAVPTGFMADTSHNVLNVFYSNSREQLFGIHWGDIPTVGIETPTWSDSWGLQIDAAHRLFRITGFRSDLPKNMEIFDRNGRVVYRKESFTGVDIEHQFTEASGVYIVVVSEGQMQRAFKVLIP